VKNAAQKVAQASLSKRNLQKVNFIAALYTQIANMYARQ
jgi:hypothetical protein